MEDVIIIGAGLSGLSAAYYLKNSGIDALLIEARERCGGRILTAKAPGNGTALEMGATWFTDKHSSFIRLLEELQLTFFRQFQKGKAVFEFYPDPPQLFDMTEDGEPSYRIAGGTSSLIKALTAYIGQDRISLNSPIVEVKEKQEHIEVMTLKEEKFSCRRLILTLPPYLIRAQKINFVPELPVALSNLMENTHTWMGEALKFALEYRSPFWREKGYSGTVMSQSGIASEVYDHCNYEVTHFALKGFLSVDAAALSEKEREALVVEQLRKFLGTEAGGYLSYTEKVWKNDPYTYANYGKIMMPHQNNGHLLYQQTLMNGKLFLAGTETSSHFGGYMEGAVYSGLTAAKSILSKKDF